MARIVYGRRKLVLSDLLRRHGVRHGVAQTESVDALLTLRSLSVRYGVIRALNSVDLQVAAGETVAIIGPNGAGKTTLARAIMGNLSVAAGDIFFDGVRITDMKTYKVARRGMSLVPEGRGVLPTLTVDENLKVAASSARHMHSQSTDEIYERMSVLRPLRSRHAGQLSGGQLQLLAIGRALMGDPRLLILDEPSMGLSPQSVDLITRVIRDLKQSGSTLLILEQNAQLAFSLADFLHVIERGEIRVSGTTEELRDKQEVKNSYLGVVSS